MAPAPPGLYFPALVTNRGHMSSSELCAKEVVIISALPLMILLGLIGMAAEAINPTADKPNETTVEVRDAAITAPAEEATPAPELN